MIIGANSRLAREIVGFAPGRSFRRIARAAQPSSASDLVLVDDYRSIPPSAFEGVHTVINCVGTPQGTYDTLKIINSDVAVEAAIRARAAGCRQFIQLSSLSVYGSSTVIDQSTSEQPTAAYGCSKLLADTRLKVFASPLFDVTLLRIPTVYGPHLIGKIGSLARAMKRLGAFPVPRDLPVRSAIHITNAAYIVHHLIERPVDGVLIACDHENFSLSALASAIEATTGRVIRLVETPNALLHPLKYLAPSLYTSLYSNSIIAPSAAITTNLPLPVSLAEGLRNLFS